MQNSKVKISSMLFTILFGLTALVGGLCLSFNKPVTKDDGFSHAAVATQPGDNQLWTEEQNTIPINPGEEIRSPQQLAYIAAKVNIVKDPEYQHAHFGIATTIDLSAHIWVPIGTEDFPFRGRIDAADTGIIQGMFVERSESSVVPASAGLFGVLAGGATIAGLQVNNSFVNILFYQDREVISAGAIAGKILDGVKILGCRTNAVNVWAKINVGGIVGEIASDACVVNGCISSDGRVGDDYSYFAGGIVGCSMGEILDCTNGNQVAGRSVGGIVGRDMSSRGSTILHCENNGVISIGEEAGGILGTTVYATNILHCTNTANIKATTSLGGIIGSSNHANASISNCVSRGEFSGNNDGGIAGRFTGSIQNCQNYAVARAGIVYSLNDGIVSNCTNYGQDVSGGIVYELQSGEINNCKNFGNNCGAGMAWTMSGGLITSCTNSGTGAKGGIVYQLQGGEVKDCKNFGANCEAGIVRDSRAKITGCVNYADVKLAGIVSALRSSEAIVESCVNRGNCSGGGGIVGAATDGAIRNCVNYGDVSVGDESAGGIIGLISSASSFEIINCINHGNVTGGDGQYVGGLIGWIDASSKINVVACSNEGIISGNVVGGFIGLLTGTFGEESIIKNCLNTGTLQIDCSGVSAVDTMHSVGGFIGTIMDVESATRIISCFSKCNIEYLNVTSFELALVYAGTMIGCTMVDGNLVQVIGCGAVVEGDGIVVGNKFYGDATSVNPDFFGAESSPITIDSSYALVYDAVNEAWVAAVANSIDCTHEDFFSVNDNFMDGYPVPRDIFWIGESMDYASHGGIILILQNIANDVEEYDGIV